MAYDKLKLSNQLCHPLYSAANAVVRSYTPLLKKIDLTYPQYVVMMSLWEQDGVNIKALIESTFFDSGSLTPLLKRLADKDLIRIMSRPEDQRQKIIELTKKGEKLKEQASKIPDLMFCKFHLSISDLNTMKRLAEKLLSNMSSVESE